MSDVREGALPSLHVDGLRSVWLRVEKNIDFLETPGCWVWKGHQHRQGYGVTSFKGQTHLAHRMLYMMLVGPIPEGKELHHVCENVACCNPAHLQPVTPKVHHTLNPRSIANGNRLKTHCPKGHEYTDENTWAQIPKRYPYRYDRVCRTCYPERKSCMTVAEWKAQSKEQAS